MIENIEKVNFNHIHITTLIFSLRPLKKNYLKQSPKTKRSCITHLTKSISISDDIYLFKVNIETLEKVVKYV